jgi:hypothetical protein
VLASLGLFALDQANGASKHQVAALASAPPSTTTTVAPTTTTIQTPRGPESEPRRFIDGAAQVLTAPFRSLVQSNSEWAKRIGYSVLAVLVYGFGLGYLARWVRT